MTRDWPAWHDEYDDSASSLSRRLAEVRSQLALILAGGDLPLRLLSLCSGDGRDTVPVLADSPRPVSACLVELDPELAQAGRETGGDLDLEMRTEDAGATKTFADRLPVDVLMLCGVFGNVADADVARTVTAARSMLTAGGYVIWTRGNRVPDDPTAQTKDPAEWVRGLFAEAGFDEVAFVRPDDATYRVGVARLDQPRDEPLPERLFSFVT
ncbi:MAG: class I SAM-dependent methyltransferase [Nocardioides sp.]